MTKYIKINTSIPGPKAQKLLEQRLEHIPRGPFNTALNFVERAEGALVTDVDGNTLIDFAGAIGTINVGHCPKEVVARLKNQIEHYLHTSFHVMMYEPYIRLAEKLNKITPGSHHKKTFFLNSGAEAVENAIKIARKYTKRRGIISFERGFHGRTYMAMSLTSKVNPYKNGFGPFATDTYKMPYPYYYRKPQGMTNSELDQMILAKFEDFFISEVPAEEIAAIIMEPVQGEGGFISPSLNFVQGVKTICEKHGILFIADEVQTGFGRTGKMFGIEHYDIIPDLMTFSKSIAAGIPLSAVTGRSEVMEAPAPGEIGGTYGGSPLGCVAALEVIDLIEREKLDERAVLIGKQIVDRFKMLQAVVEEIGDIRTMGAMTAIEFVKERRTREPHKDFVAHIVQEANRKGVIILGAGIYSNVLRFLCPLVITDEQLQEGLDVIEDIILEQIH